MCGVNYLSIPKERGPVFSGFMWLFIHIPHVGFIGKGAIIKLSLYLWSNPEGYGENTDAKPRQGTGKCELCAYLHF